MDSVGEVQNIESAEYDGDDALEVTVELKHFEEAVRLVVNPSTMRIRSQYAKRPDGRTEHLEFGDYRSIEGVNIPHSFDAKVDGEPEGQFVLHKASFNIGVSSSLFHPKSLRD